MLLCTWSLRWTVLVSRGIAPHHDQTDLKPVRMPLVTMLRICGPFRIHRVTARRKGAGETKLAAPSGSLSERGKGGKIPRLIKRTRRTPSLLCPIVFGKTLRPLKESSGAGSYKRWTHSLGMLRLFLTRLTPSIISFILAATTEQMQKSWRVQTPQCPRRTPSSIPLAQPGRKWTGTSPRQPVPTPRRRTPSQTGSPAGFPAPQIY